MCTALRVVFRIYCFTNNFFFQCFNTNTTQTHSRKCPIFVCLFLYNPSSSSQEQKEFIFILISKIDYSLFTLFSHISTLFFYVENMYLKKKKIFLTRQNVNVWIERHCVECTEIWDGINCIPFYTIECILNVRPKLTTFRTPNRNILNSVLWISIHFLW